MIHISGDKSVSPKQKGRVTDLDVRLGRNLCFYRGLAGLSQKKLGQAAGVSYQQIQKYERARNRIPASRLQELSDILRVPLPKFYGAETWEKHSGDFPEINADDLSFLRLLKTSNCRELYAIIRKLTRLFAERR